MICSTIVALAISCSGTASDDPFCSFYLGLLDDRGRRCESFARFADVHCSVRMSAPETDIVRIVLPNESDKLALPVLFDLEIQEANGTPLDLPFWRYDFRMIDRERVCERHAQIREVRHHLRLRIAIDDWFGWNSIILPQGHYRMRVIYQGPPSFEGAFESAGRGSAVSDWAKFSISADVATHEWGEPVEGFRASCTLTPQGKMYFFDESARAVFYVQNFGSKPVRFWRKASGMSRDNLTVTPPSGERFLKAHANAHGYYAIVEWTLDPGEIVRLPYRHVVFDKSYGHPRPFFGEGEGTYKLVFEVAVGLVDEAPGSLLALRTPPKNIRLRERPGALRR